MAQRKPNKQKNFDYTNWPYTQNSTGLTFSSTSPTGSQIETEDKQIGGQATTDAIPTDTNYLNVCGSAPS